MPGPPPRGPRCPPPRHTHLDGVHQQASHHHAEARQQDGHHHLAHDGEGGLGEDAAGAAGELTAEASQLRALKAELQVQLGDHHGQAGDAFPGCPSLGAPNTGLHPHQDAFPKESTRAELPGAPCCRRSPLPLGQGPEPTVRNKGRVTQPRSGLGHSCCPLPEDQVLLQEWLPCPVGPPSAGLPRGGSLSPGATLTASSCPAHAGSGWTGEPEPREARPW